MSAGDFGNSACERSNGCRLGEVSGLHHGDLAAAMRGEQPALNIHGTERFKEFLIEK
jgi:hypothetical protein